MKKLSAKRVLKAVSSYFSFFLLVAFVVTCCMMLFITTLTRDLHLTLTQEHISAAAKLTFGNVVVLTLLFTLMDAARRKLMVERPVRIITQATNRIMQGDFSVRIKPFSRALGGEDFNPIAEAINNMASELSGTETLRLDFIANVSHELKTPLSVMANYASLLSDPELPGAQRKEYAAAIGQAARRQSSLISNILKLNKLENQQIFPKTEGFDLTEQLRQCILSFENIWEEKRLEMDIRLQEEVFVTSDEELLCLVWNNLLSNAMKFTPQGGKISVTLTRHGGSVSVSVEDTGCGFGEAVGKRLFEKFYQADASHATDGNGLGLALVKRVVDILGAQITVESTLGQGSRFCVRLTEK